MGTRIYIADTSSLEDDGLFSFYYNQMTDYRRSKIDRVRLARDKRLSLGVGVLLEKAAREWGVGSTAVSLTERGKPYFSFEPGVHFSLSHSGESAMCALSDVPIGCDAEMTEKCDLRLAERFFSEPERRFIAEQADFRAKKYAFCRIWTLKESFVKMLGVGMAMPFSDFTVNVDEKIIGVRSDIPDCDCSFHEIDLGDGYCRSVCEKRVCGGVKPVVTKIDFSSAAE